MALIIETGSIVTGANSYVTAEEARAYALSRGIALSADDSVLEPQLVKAMDFLESHRERFQGAKVAKEQRLQWPRSGAVVDGFDVEETEIPQLLKDAQCQLTIDLSAGEDLMPNSDGREVIRKKVDVIETEYSSQGGPVKPVFAKAMALIEPLFQSAVTGFTLETGRI